MTIVESTYHEFPNAEILDLRSYKTALKHMSFSLRDGEDNQEVFAYVSFMHENIKGIKGDGVRITEIENQVGAAADERLFDDIKSVVKGYKGNNGYRFDYMWFSPCDDIGNISVADALAKSIGFTYDESTKIWFYWINRKE